MLKRISLFVLAAFVGIAAQADTTKEVEQIRAQLAKTLPQLTPGLIEPSPIPGLYQVAIDGDILYVSSDGRYALQATAYDMHENNNNVTEEARVNVRKSYLKEVAEADSIDFKADDKKHSITVFTDIDCGYCRKLHDEIAQINDHGIEVRYMLFPRNGLAGPSYDKAVSVWCAKDQQDSLTQAKAGKTVEAKTCAHSVNAQFELGQKMGVRGTPAILLEDGQMIQGYRPADELAEILSSEG